MLTRTSGENSEEEEDIVAPSLRLLFFYLSSSKRQKAFSRVAVLNGLKASIESFNSTLRDFSDKCHDYNQHGNRQAAQPLQASASSRQCRDETMQRLRQAETYLDHGRMVALVDLVSVDRLAPNVCH